MVADVVDAYSPSFSSPLPLSECGPLWLDESNFGQDQCIAGIRRKYVWQLMQWRTKRKTRELVLSVAATRNLIPVGWACEIPAQMV